MTTSRFFSQEGILRQIITISIAIWIIAFLVFLNNPYSMFIDSDPLWHIAAGHYMRAQGGMLYRDLWSFTAGDTLWFNAAWLWDLLYSHIYQWGDWYGGVVFANSITLATITATLFMLCYIRSGSAMAAFIVVVASVTMFDISARPTQITALFILLTYGLLEAVSRAYLSRRWLILLPLMVALWANMHGGVLSAFLFLGIYGLVSLINRQWDWFRALCITGVVSLIAVTINPYGADIITLNLSNMGGPMKEILFEWQSPAFTMHNMLGHIYFPLFFILMIMKPATTSLSEKLCILVWLFLGFSTTRHLMIFCLVSAPVVAASLAQVMTLNDAYFQRVALWFRSRRALIAMCTASLAITILSTTSTVERLYGHQYFTPLIDLSQELEFIQTHYPDTHFYTQYELGGHIIFQTKGQFPVFIDGREETAYPEQVIEDHIAFLKHEPDWQERFERYPIGGLLLDQAHPHIASISKTPGWAEVFRGENGVVFAKVK